MVYYYGKQRRSSASHLMAWANRVNTVFETGVSSVFLCAADSSDAFSFWTDSGKSVCGTDYLGGA